jgi:hypothetical protein
MTEQELQDEQNRLLLTALIEAVKAVNDGLREQAAAINSQAAALNHLADAIDASFSEEEEQQQAHGGGLNGRIIEG